MLILVKFSKDFDFGQTFTKNSIEVKFFENIDFGWYFIKNFKFWSKFLKNLDFGENCRKLSILVKFTKIMKILILVKIFEKCRLRSKLTKLSILEKSEKKCWF